MTRSRTLVVVASACLGSGMPPAFAADAAARGAGATFPQPAYARWAALYAAETGEVIAYDGIGSGADGRIHRPWDASLHVVVHKTVAIR